MGALGATVVFRIDAIAPSTVFVGNHADDLQPTMCESSSE